MSRLNNIFSNIIQEVHSRITKQKLPGPDIYKILITKFVRAFA